MRPEVHASALTKTDFHHTRGGLKPPLFIWYAMRLEIPFVGPDYANRSSNINAQRTVNLWPRTQGAGAKARVTLEGTPGLVLAGTAGTGPWRSNAVKFGASLYAVSGATLFALNSNLSATSIGTLSTSGGRVELVAGRDYLLIVDGTAGYAYDGTTFATIADADFPSGVTHCTYLDGWFIVNEGSSDQFWKCETLEDPTAWNALDFATAEAAPDNVLAHVATFKDLYLLGETTSQVFYNSGNPSFPFDPYPGGTIDIGIHAKYSIAKSPSGLFFLATTSEGDVAVVRLVGTAPQVISEDIAWDLSQMTATDDATGFVYRINGRTIYQISFPSEDRTFEYVVEENSWVERKSYGIGRYRAAGHGWIGNKHVIFDYSDGSYYRVDYSDYDEDGDAIERIRRSQVLHSSGNRIIAHELVVEFEAGVGIASGQGEDPQAMLRYSDDGGHTWSSELWTSIGRIGEYERRAVWRKLGQFRSRIYEVTITDPVKVVILAAYQNSTLCNS